MRAGEDVHEDLRAGRHRDSAAGHRGTGPRRPRIPARRGRVACVAAPGRSRRDRRRLGGCGHRGVRGRRLHTVVHGLRQHRGAHSLCAAHPAQRPAPEQRELQEERARERGKETAGERAWTHRESRTNRARIQSNTTDRVRTVGRSPDAVSGNAALHNRVFHFLRHLFQDGALNIVKRVVGFVDNVTSIGFLLLTVHIPGVP